jgi:hypothetical protein
MRRSAPHLDYTPRCKSLPGTLSASFGARFHRLRLLRQAVRQDPERPAAPAVLVRQEVRQGPARPFHLLARPRPARPFAPVRSPLRKWKVQLQPRYFSHACAHLSRGPLSGPLGIGRSFLAKRQKKAPSMPGLPRVDQKSNPRHTNQARRGSRKSPTAASPWEIAVSPLRPLCPVWSRPNPEGTKPTTSIFSSNCGSVATL